MFSVCMCVWEEEWERGEREGLVEFSHTQQLHFSMFANTLTGFTHFITLITKLFIISFTPLHYLLSINEWVFIIIVIVIVSLWCISLSQCFSSCFSFLSLLTMGFLLVFLSLSLPLFSFIFCLFYTGLLIYLSFSPYL